MSDFAHIKWLEEKFSEEIKREISRLDLDWSPSDLLDVLASADPSTGKKAVDWLLRKFLNRGYRWEDVAEGSSSKAWETLDQFSRHRNRLEGSAKNLGSYTSLADVWRAIDVYAMPSETEAEPSGKALKREEKIKALKESIIVDQGEDWTIAVPLTRNAAVWWGKGTRWCTAARENNYFDHYNHDSPLIVFSLTKGLEKNHGQARKFQLWINVGRESSFMDEMDATVSPELVRENWEVFKPLIEWGMEKCASMIKWLPKEYWRQHQIISAANIEGSILRDVPLELLTPEFCSDIVKARYSYLYFLPKTVLTPSLYMQAFEQNAQAYHYFPNELKSYTLSLAYAAHGGNIHNIHNIPEDHRTRELYECFCQANPLAIKDIPEEFITPEIALNAINKQIGLIRFVKKDIFSEDDFLKIIENSTNNSVTWKVKLPKLHTERVILAWFNKFYGNFTIPHEYQTREICKQAVLTQNITSIYSINPKFLDQEMVLLLLENDQISPDDIPLWIASKEVYMCAIERKHSLYEIPERYLDQELCLAAIRSRDINIAYVPKSLLTLEFWNMAVEISANIVNYLDPKEIPDSIWLRAAALNPSVENMPQHLKSPEQINKESLRKEKEKEEKKELVIQKWNASFLEGLAPNRAELTPQLSPK